MNEHQRWAEERLVSYLLDTLPEVDAQKVEELLGGIPEYQEILEGRQPEDIGHIPAALLARWQTAGLHIVGVERVLILQHLGSCSNCREELELVGGSLQEWADAPESAPHEPMRPRPIKPGPHSRVRETPPWTAWFGGAAMGIAAGILLMVLLPQGPSSTDGLHGTALPVVVPQNLRSGEAAAVDLSDSKTPLLLALVLPRLEDELGAELVVRDPAEEILSRTGLHLGPQAQRTAQIVLHPEDGWSNGSYSIELLVTGEVDVRELGRFTVQVNLQD